MTERVLSARALNRALLARQGLLERTGAPIPRMLEQMGGLQAQYAPSMYIGLWSRLDGFERNALTGALEARRVIQGTLMRSTIHLVSAADYWPLALAVREARRAHWLNATRREVGEPELEAAAERLRSALAGGGFEPARGHECHLEPAIRGGGDTRRPATLRRKELDELLDLPGLPLPDPDTPAPVRFLPTWDASLLVHARRTGVLPEEHRPRIFHVKAPQSFPTFLVDGAVAGTWRHGKGAIELTPFGRLDTAARRDLAAESERLATFHA